MLVSVQRVFLKKYYFGISSSFFFLFLQKYLFPQTTAPYLPLDLTNFSIAEHWFFWTMDLSFCCLFLMASSSFWCFFVNLTKLLSDFTSSGVMASNLISSVSNKKNTKWSRTEYKIWFWNLVQSMNINGNFITHDPYNDIHVGIFV